MPTHLTAPVWPRSRAGVSRLFKHVWPGPERIPGGEQADLLIELLDMYRAQRLGYRRGDVALCDICPNAMSCWKDLERSARRRPTAVDYQENGGIILPWVGRHYTAGGVAVIGINPNIAADDYTFLLIEHGISWEHYIPTFEQGSLNERGSSFGGCAMRTAGLVLDDLDGRPISDREPRELIDVVHRTARLQAVKCVPKRERSVPSPEMSKRCPEFLLARELAILRPSRIVILGAPARDAVHQMPGYRSLGSRAAHLQRGDLALHESSASVYTLSHPNARGGAWAQGFDSLKRHLARKRQ